MAALMLDVFSSSSVRPMEAASAACFALAAASWATTVSPLCKLQIAAAIPAAQHCQGRSANLSSRPFK